MERLQTAIEKARAQRRQQSQPSPAKPETLRLSAEDRTTSNSEAWAALEEVHFDAQHLRHNRITAFEAGVDSAPFDLLRTRVLQQARQHGWKRIALVSPHSACGKSTTAANLGFSLSRHPNLHSMVFDFDLRRAGLTKILGQRLSSSMADVLGGHLSFAEQAKRYGSNVAFGLNGGKKASNPSELLQSADASNILDDITEQFAPDIMVFDMPPLMASDDNFGFLQNVDCALIMVAAEKTSMSQIDVAERQVAELTNVMGIVLNKCRYTSGAHGHEYDYY